MTSTVQVEPLEMEKRMSHRQELAKELRKLLKKATDRPWKWGWRKDDEQAPGSIYGEWRTGQAWAVAMCPRYGAEVFEKDAPLICFLRNHADELLAALEGTSKSTEMSVDVGELRQELADFVGSSEGLAWRLWIHREKIAAALEELADTERRRHEIQCICDQMMIDINVLASQRDAQAEELAALRKDRDELLQALGCALDPMTSISAIDYCTALNGLQPNEVNLGSILGQRNRLDAQLRESEQRRSETMAMCEQLKRELDEARAALTVEKERRNRIWKICVEDWHQGDSE